MADDHQERPQSPRGKSGFLSESWVIVDPSIRWHNSVSVAESDVGWIVAFRSAKVARIPRHFRGAKGDKGLSATRNHSA